MPKAKTINYNMTRGGSPHGFTKRAKIVNCPRRANLDEQAAQNDPGSSEAPATRIGTMGHAFHDMFYSKAIAGDTDLTKIKLTLAGEQLPPEWLEDRAEAERVCQAYYNTFPQNGLGRVLGTEVPIDDSPKVREAVFTDEPFTARVDLAVKPTAKKCHDILRMRSVDIDSGLWLADYKFLSRRSGYLVDEYLTRLQFTSYMLAWEAHFGQRPNGLLADVIFKTKMVGFFTIAVPYPDEEQKNALRSFMQGVAAIKKHLGDWPNPENCFTWGRPCGHLVDGTCKRG